MRRALTFPTRQRESKGNGRRLRELIYRPFAERSAAPSPFDRLVHERERTLSPFDLDYCLEIYVLPILLGARRTTKANHTASVLQVPFAHFEPDAAMGI